MLDGFLVPSDRSRSPAGDSFLHKQIQQSVCRGPLPRLLRGAVERFCAKRPAVRQCGPSHCRKRRLMTGTGLVQQFVSRGPQQTGLGELIQDHCRVAPLSGSGTDPGGVSATE